MIKYGHTIYFSKISGLYNQKMSARIRICDCDNVQDSIRYIQKWTILHEMGVGWKEKRKNKMCRDTNEI